MNLFYICVIDHLDYQQKATFCNHVIEYASLNLLPVPVWWNWTQAESVKIYEWLFNITRMS